MLRELLSRAVCGETLATPYDPERFHPERVMAPNLYGANAPKPPQAQQASGLGCWLLAQDVPPMVGAERGMVLDPPPPRAPQNVAVAPAPRGGEAANFEETTWRTPFDRAQELVATGSLVNAYTGEVTSTYEDAMPMPNRQPGDLKRERKAAQLRLLAAEGNVTTRQKREQANPLPSADAGQLPAGSHAAFQVANDVHQEQVERNNRDVFFNRNELAPTELQMTRNPYGFDGYNSRLRINPHMPPTQELDKQDWVTNAAVQATTAQAKRPKTRLKTDVSQARVGNAQAALPAEPILAQVLRKEPTQRNTQMQEMNVRTESLYGQAPPAERSLAPEQAPRVARTTVRAAPGAMVASSSSVLASLRGKLNVRPAATNGKEAGAVPTQAAQVRRDERVTELELKATQAVVAPSGSFAAEHQQTTKNDSRSMPTANCFGASPSLSADAHVAASSMKPSAQLLSSAQQRSLALAPQGQVTSQEVSRAREHVVSSRLALQQQMAASSLAQTSNVIEAAKSSLLGIERAGPQLSSLQGPVASAEVRDATAHKEHVGERLIQQRLQEEAAGVLGVGLQTLKSQRQEPSRATAVYGQARPAVASATATVTTRPEWLEQAARVVSAGAAPGRVSVAEHASRRDESVVRDALRSAADLQGPAPSAEVALHDDAAPAPAQRTLQGPEAMRTSTEERTLKQDAPCLTSTGATDASTPAPGTNTSAQQLRQELVAAVPLQPESQQGQMQQPAPKSTCRDTRGLNALESRPVGYERSGGDAPETARFHPGQRRMRAEQLVTTTPQADQLLQSRAQLGALTVQVREPRSHMGRADCETLLQGAGRGFAQAPDSRCDSASEDEAYDWKTPSLPS